MLLGLALAKVANNYLRTAVGSLLGQPGKCRAEDQGKLQDADAAGTGCIESLAVALQELAQVHGMPWSRLQCPGH
jgi:hypothetical protein